MSKARHSRGVLRRAVRRLAAIIIVLLLLPYALVLLYVRVPPVSTLMLARWATGARVERIWVPITAMSPALPLSVIAAEDARFCSHRGIDWQALRDTLDEAEDIGDVRGGSTLTQQTAKNLFLWPGRSFVRKALEFPLALWIDLVMPKRRVLEIYLNVAEWGPNGEFGAEAASRHAFGKNARALTPREAALLAAILPNPVRRSAQRPGAAVQRLAAIYEARAQGSMSLAECLDLAASP